MIVRGKRYPVHGFELRLNRRMFRRPFRRETRAIVNHWTGAENAPPLLFHSLARRRLSVHFAIAADGIVWQLADAQAFCAHAKGANAFSVGIELVSRATRIDAPGIVRPLITETIHGREITYCGFTTAQLDAARALNHALCSIYGIPTRAPKHSDGSVYSHDLPAGVVDLWRGILGHLHVHLSKADPGLLLLEHVQARALVV